MCSSDLNVAAPTILVEPEKTEENTTEGELPVEGVAEDATTTEEGKDKSAKPSDDKTKDKSTKPTDNKEKTASGDKVKSVNKEKETKKNNIG
mgnify:CR=1 FL=1